MTDLIITDIGMNQITDQIWLGNHLDAADKKKLGHHKIYHVLNLARSLPPALNWEDGVNHFHCGMRDNSNHRAFYVAAMHILEGILSSGGSVLVHCWQGISRSPFIVACHLVKTGKFNSLREAEVWLKDKRPIVNINAGHYKSFDPKDPSVFCAEFGSGVSDDEL